MADISFSTNAPSLWTRRGFLAGLGAGAALALGGAGQAFAAGGCLAVYFSRSGNTAKVAGFIHEAVGAELFRLEPVHPYPDDYDACVKQGKQEVNGHVLPPVKRLPENLGAYGTVFVGSPIWWGTLAPCVWTFLEQAATKGLRIAPFCTHEGSGMSKAVADLKRRCPEAVVLKGFECRGSRVDASREAVASWAKAQVKC